MRRFCTILALVCALLDASASAQTTPSSSWPEGAWLRGQQVVIQFTGVVHAAPGIVRTKEEARRRAMEVIARVLGGESFDALVKDYTDDPVGAARQGDLGLVGPGVLAPELEAALLDLKEGEVTRTPVQTAFGFHVVRRLPSERRVVIRHILVSYTGALRAKIGLKRTREQAKTRADELLAKLAEGTAFDELAKSSSDDIGSAADGGLLGDLHRGLTVPEFESAAAALEVGETSAVIETPFGFDILRRDR